MSFKILKNKIEGYNKDEICNRIVSDKILIELCDGVIDELNTKFTYCPSCGWDQTDEIFISHIRNLI